MLQGKIKGSLLSMFEYKSFNIISVFCGWKSGLGFGYDKYLGGLPEKEEEKIMKYFIGTGTTKYLGTLTTKLIFLKSYSVWFEKLLCFDIKFGSKLAMSPI